MGYFSDIHNRITFICALYTAYVDRACVQWERSREVSKRYKFKT